MKITITPIQERTERTRKKLIESKAWDKRTASITGEGYKSQDYNTPHNPGDTRRTIEITNNETGDDRTRANENGWPEVDHMEAMNQLEQARIEYEDYMKEGQERANEKMGKAIQVAEKQRADFFDRDNQEQLRVDPTDSMNTRTEQEHQERVKDLATEMVQISK